MVRGKSSNHSAADLIPDRPSLPSLRAAAADCQACDLWKWGTQTVFGEGRRRAKVMFIGEQPGNEEDLNGKPFVGPAGKLFDSVLKEAGIDRSLTYVTNVVNISNGSRGGSVGSTRNLTQWKLPRVDPGCRPK